LKFLPAYIIVILLLTACAQIKPPTGGPQDTDPPELLKTTPPNFSTNFVGNTVVMEFNEFVQLKNLSQQLIINPPMKERPEFRLKGKKVIGTFKSPLLENTTYVINFGDAIVDLNEGNKASGLQYVFSTGDFLDSLMVQGQVLNAFDRKAVSNVLVMLYSNHNDTMPYKALPDYFAKTDNQGKFQINYIREGVYRAFALADANNDYKYNPPAEAMAFLDSLVVPGLADSTNVPLHFNMFNEPDTAQFIEDQKLTYYGQMRLVFKQPADSVSVKSLNPDVEIITEHGMVGDTLWAWIKNRNLLGDLEEFKVLVNASPNFTDTLRWRLTKRRTDVEPIMEIKDNLLFNFDIYQPMRFRFNHPIASHYPEKIELYEDTVPVEFDWQSTSSTRKFELHYPWKEGTPYRVFFPDSTFLDIFNLANDTLDHTVNTREERFYGNMSLTLNYETQEPFILQLLNDKGLVIQELFPEKPGIIQFNKMLPGSYAFKVIVDSNGNGEWDPGDFLLKRQPEKVLVFQDAVQIRSNWDLELSWELELD
jgi:hypothetical protein